MCTLNMYQQQIIHMGLHLERKLAGLVTPNCVGVDYEVRNSELLKQMALQIFPLSSWQTLSPLKRGEVSHV